MNQELEATMMLRQVFSDMYDKRTEAPILPFDENVPSATAGVWHRVSYVCQSPPRVVKWAEVATGFKHESMRNKSLSLWQQFYQNAATTFTKPLGSFTLYIVRRNEDMSNYGSGSKSPKVVTTTAKKIQPDDRALLPYLLKKRNTFHVILKVEENNPFKHKLPLGHADFMKKKCADPSSREGGVDAAFTQKNVALIKKRQQEDERAWRRSVSRSSSSYTRKRQEADDKLSQRRETPVFENIGPGIDTSTIANEYAAFVAQRTLAREKARRSEERKRQKTEPASLSFWKSFVNAIRGNRK